MFFRLWKHRALCALANSRSVCALFLFYLLFLILRTQRIRSLAITMNFHFCPYEPPKPNMLIQKGTQVRIHGLESNKGKHLNGKIAVAMKFFPSTSRWSVAVSVANDGIASGLYHRWRGGFCPSDIGSLQHKFDSCWLMIRAGKLHCLEGKKAS